MRKAGIAAVWDRNDSFEDHVADTLDAGAGLCNEQAVRTIVEEGPGRYPGTAGMGSEL